MKELTEFMYASQFAEATGYPLDHLKKLLKNGAVPYKKMGRKYLLNTKKTIRILIENFDNNITVSESRNIISANNATKIKKEELQSSGFLPGLDSILR